MKKMMMIVAIGLLAVGVNAASLQWINSGVRTHSSLTGSADGATTANNGSFLSGAIAYLFVGTLNAAAIDTAIQGGTFNVATAVANATTGTSGSTGLKTYGTFNPGDTITAYMVVFDSGSYNAAGEGNYWISSSFWTTFATGNPTFSATMTTTSNWTHYNNVPEPTSMALLALGAAVVGLRRRFKA